MLDDSAGPIWLFAALFAVWLVAWLLQRIGENEALGNLSLQDVFRFKAHQAFLMFLLMLAAWRTAAWF